MLHVFYSLQKYLVKYLHIFSIVIDIIKCVHSCAIADGILVQLVMQIVL